MTAESMMTMSAPTKSRGWWRLAAIFVLVAAGGAALGNAVGQYLKHSHKVSHVNASDVVALTLTAFYIGVSLLLLWISNHRMRLARLFEGNAAEICASDAEVLSVRYQALVMTLAGILLAVPILGVHLFSGNAMHSVLLLVCIVLLFAMQTFFNIRLWRNSDEFVRGAITAHAAWTFAIGQGGLFLWSAAERIGLVKQTSAWGLTVAMMLLYLFVGSVLSLRTARQG